MPEPQTSKVVSHKRRVTITVRERLWSDGCRTSVETSDEQHAYCDALIGRYRMAREQEHQAERLTGNA